MKENKDLKPVEVLKADMALSDLTSGGKLVAEQANQFFLVNIKGQVVMEKVTVMTTSRETFEMPKMTTFGSRVWHPGTESQALTLAQRVKPGFGKTTLTSQEVVAQVDFPRNVLTDQVEGPNWQNTMLAYLGMHTKRDFEEMIVQGYTLSTDAFLALFNGMIYGASSNSTSAAGAALSSTLMKALFLTMPEEFADQENLVWLTSRTARGAFKDELAARGTPLGDAHQTNRANPVYEDSDLIRVPAFPSNMGVGANQTVVLYLNPKNFLFSFHQNVEAQSEYSIRERVWTVVLTARVAQGYMHEPMVAKLTAVLSA